MRGAIFALSFIFFGVIFHLPANADWDSHADPSPANGANELLAEAMSGSPVSDLESVQYLRTLSGSKIVVLRNGAEFVVHLLGVDAPEVSEGTAEAYLSAYLVAYSFEIPGKLWLEFDRMESKDEESSTYAWVWYAQDGTDPELVNPMMIAYGVAPYSPPEHSTRYQEQLSAAAKYFALVTKSPSGSSYQSGNPNSNLPGNSPSPSQQQGVWAELVGEKLKRDGLSEWTLAVHNDTGQPMDAVRVEFFVLDSSGHVIASTTAYSSNLAVGQTDYVQLMEMDVNVNAVASYRWELD